jgi:hypothetical protein
MEHKSSKHKTSSQPRSKVTAHRTVPQGGVVRSSDPILTATPRYHAWSLEAVHLALVPTMSDHGSATGTIHRQRLQQYSPLLDQAHTRIQNIDKPQEFQPVVHFTLLSAMIHHEVQPSKNH